jgi:hypothetical protein
MTAGNAELENDCEDAFRDALAFAAAWASSDGPALTAIWDNGDHVLIATCLAEIICGEFEIRGHDPAEYARAWLARMRDTP